MANNDQLRHRCRYFRRVAHRSQKELALELNVTASALSKWESGAAQWPRDSLVRYCELLELDEEHRQELFHLAGMESNDTRQVSHSNGAQKEGDRSTADTKIPTGTTSPVQHKRGDKGDSEVRTHRTWLSRRTVIPSVVAAVLVMSLLIGTLLDSKIDVIPQRGEPTPELERIVYGMGWTEISAYWEKLPDSAVRLTENSKNNDFGKVESEIITLDAGIAPVLRVHVTAIDPSSSFTIQLDDKRTGVKKDILKGISSPGVYTLNLAEEMDWHDQEAFTINIWIAGEGKSVLFDQVSIKPSERAGQE